MKESTKKFLAKELVILGVLLVITTMTFFVGAQFGVVLLLKFSLPTAYLLRWVWWGVNFCGQYDETRGVARLGVLISGWSLIAAAVLLGLRELARSNFINSVALTTCLVLGVLGAVLLNWGRRKFLASKELKSAASAVSQSPT